MLNYEATAEPRVQEVVSWLIAHGGLNFSFSGPDEGGETDIFVFLTINRVFVIMFWIL